LASLASSGLVTQLSDLRLAFGGVEEPHDHATGRPHFARRALTTHRKHARRPLRTDRQREWLAGLLCRGDSVAEQYSVLARQTRARRDQFSKIFGRRHQPQPVGQPIGQFKPAIGSHHHRQCRGGRQQRVQLVVACQRRRGGRAGAQSGVQDPARCDDRQSERRPDKAEGRRRHHQKRPPIITSSTNPVRASPIERLHLRREKCRHSTSGTRTGSGRSQQYQR
jgi:hypothetical protein